jgi:hypothetical protein
VTIENLAWDDFLGPYDRPATFSYWIRPIGKKPVYQHNFKWDDYVQMAGSLESLKGKSLLSINRHARDSGALRRLHDQAGESQLYGCQGGIHAGRRAPDQELLMAMRCNISRTFLSIIVRRGKKG